MPKRRRGHGEGASYQRESDGLWCTSRLVFPSQVGTPLSARNLVRHFKLVLPKAGLPETIRFHDLRHSCATLLIAQGVHPRVVMEILGHSQISVTMNTYGHVLPETQRDAAAKLDALLNERAPSEPNPDDDSAQAEDGAEADTKVEQGEMKETEEHGGRSEDDGTPPDAVDSNE
jgi:integrase